MTTLDVMTYGGAVGDGITDDSAAFQNCLDNADEVYIPFRPTGYKISSPLIIEHPVRITGQNRVRLYSSGFDIRFSNVFISGVHVFNATTAFYLNTTIRSMEFIYINDCETSYCDHAIMDAGGPFLTVNLRIDDLSCWYGKKEQILLRDSFAFLFLRDITVDHARNAGTPINFASIHIANNNGATLQDVNINGNALGNGCGVKLSGCQAIHLNNVMADTLGGDGITIASSYYIYMNGVIASLNAGVGICISNTQFIQGINMVCAGRLGMTDYVNKPGLKIDSCEQIQLHNLSCRNNNMGLRMMNCDNGKISGLYSNNNTSKNITDSTNISQI